MKTAIASTCVCINQVKNPTSQKLGLIRDHRGAKGAAVRINSNPHSSLGRACILEDSLPSMRKSLKPYMAILVSKSKVQD